MTRDEDWLADLARYPARPFLKEQSIWAIWIYRWGRRIHRRDKGLRKLIVSKLYWLLYRLIETATGITLPKSARIGPGLRIWHFGNIVIHDDVTIGKQCTLRQGVTIGNRHAGGPVPWLGDNVDLGAHAHVLGGVRIGNDCKVGAMSLVLDDVPDGATVVGSPARVIERRSA